MFAILCFPSSTYSRWTFSIAPLLFGPSFGHQLCQTNSLIRAVGTRVPTACVFFGSATMSVSDLSGRAGSGPELRYICSREQM